MMECKTCNREVPKGLSRCPYCGASQAEQPARPAQPMPPVLQQPQPVRSEPKRPIKAKAAVVVFIFAAVLFFVGIGARKLFFDKGSETALKGVTTPAPVPAEGIETAAPISRPALNENLPMGGEIILGESSAFYPNLAQAGDWVYTSDFARLGRVSLTSGKAELAFSLGGSTEYQNKDGRSIAFEPYISSVAAIGDTLYIGCYARNEDNGRIAEFSYILAMPLSGGEAKLLFALPVTRIATDGGKLCFLLNGGTHVGVYDPATDAQPRFFPLAYFRFPNDDLNDGFSFGIHNDVVYYIGCTADEAAHVKHLCYFNVKTEENGILLPGYSRSMAAFRGGVLRDGVFYRGYTTDLPVQYVLADHLAEGVTDVLTVSLAASDHPGILLKDGYIYYDAGKGRYQRIFAGGGEPEDIGIELPVSLFGIGNYGPGDYVDGCLRTGNDMLYTFEGKLIADCDDMAKWDCAGLFGANGVSNALARIFSQYSAGDFASEKNDVLVLFP